MSCSSKIDDVVLEEKKVSADQQVSHFLEVKERVSNEFRSDIKLVSEKENVFDSELSQVFLREFDANMQKVNEIGIKQFYREKGLDVSLIDKLEFYQENKTNPKVYDLLKENFVYKNDKEVEALFTLIEITNSLEDFYFLKTGQHPSNWRCFANIGGALVASAGFAFITGGWSLAVTLAGKGYALFSLADSCITAYKESQVKKEHQVKYVAPEKLEVNKIFFDDTEPLKEGERLDMLNDMKKLMEYGN